MKITTIAQAALVLAGSMLLLPAQAAADTPRSTDEIRYCGPPPRDAQGNIKRSQAVINAFKKQHPCPSNGKTSGACPNWSLDHPIPMACGGCDAVWNMQWLPNAIKSSSAPTSKDRWERQVYGNPNIYEAPNCHPLGAGGIPPFK